jgi:hypothetical protein
MIPPIAVRDAQRYINTNGLKLRPQHLAAASAETGKSFDETLRLIRSLAEGATNQDQQMKERMMGISGTVPQG